PSWTGSDPHMTSSVRGRRVRRQIVPPEPAHDSGDERPGRANYVRRRWIALAVVAGALLCTYVVVFTSLFGANHVDVTGVTTISADEVRSAAAIEDGTPLVRLDTDEVRDRVAKLPKLFSVELHRSSPS